jgi:predicted metal-binding protein
MTDKIYTQKEKKSIRRRAKQMGFLENRQFKTDNILKFQKGLYGFELLLFFTVGEFPELTAKHTKDRVIFNFGFKTKDEEKIAEHWSVFQHKLVKLLDNAITMHKKSNI